MHPLTLSPSSIGLFLDCPRCFWLDKVKGVKRPSGIFPSLPNGMDRVLKEHFDKHRTFNTPPEELHGHTKGRLFPDHEKLKEWRDNKRGLRWIDPKTGFGLMGALDDLFVTEEGLYAPLDFKTRGYPCKDDTHEHYQHQMDIYSFLLEKNGMKPAGFAILIFYHPTSVNEKHDVVFDPNPVKVHTNPEKGEELFRKAVGCLVGEEPKHECEWCRWVKA
jgi:hypothetical protein